MAQTKNIYALPFRKGVQVRAISDPIVHFAHLQNAIDFVFPEGTEIMAAEEGMVVAVKADSNEGGKDPKYNDLKYTNYVFLKHANEEYSCYFHLQHNGTLVKVGDKIEKHRPIALSGNTGFTTAPHLHFHVLVFTPNVGIGWETIEIVFEEKISVFRPVISKEEINKQRERFFNPS